MEMDVYTQIAQRMALAGFLGTQTYSGDRDIYQALGYPIELTAEDFMSRYLRQDIAAAVIDRPVNATWQGDITLYEANTDDITNDPLWEDIYTTLRLKNVLKRLDRLSCIGQYGVLLLGFDDVKDQTMFSQPVIPGKRKLLYLKPYSEISATIEKFVEDPNDPRYGLPEYYNIQTGGLSKGNATEQQTIRVHHSRVLHITGNKLESEVYGLSELTQIMNRLIDLEKITGSSAEMYWRGARPGYHMKPDPDYELSDTERKNLQTQIDEYEHNLRRIFANEGIDMKALETQVSDPTNHVNVQIQMISAVTGIPQRILTGSEMGQLASTQDQDNWLRYIASRREEYAEEAILRPLIEMLQKYGILKEDAEYVIQWDELFSLSDKDKAEIGRVRSTAIKEYTSNAGAMDLISPELYMEMILGLRPEQVEKIMLQATEMMEDPLSEEENEIIKNENEGGTE